MLRRIWIPDALYQSYPYVVLTGTIMIGVILGITEISTWKVISIAIIDFMMAFYSVSMLLTRAIYK